MAKKGSGIVFTISLMDFETPGRLKAAPVLASGDFQISIDGGALANITNLPVVSPAGSPVVKITLTDAEMNGNSIAVVCRDQTDPPQWCDQMVSFLND